MPDLVSGRYGALEPGYNFLGQVTNATQSDVPVRTNAFLLGFGTATTITAPTTKKGLFVAVPVQYGDVFTKITLLIGGTEGKTAVKAATGVYSGPASTGTAAKLIANSAVLTAATGKEAAWTTEFEKSLLITPENAPHGYVYAGYCFEGTVPSLVGTELAVAAQFPWFTTAAATGFPVPITPYCYATEQEHKEAGVLKAEITLAQVIKCPFVFLQ